MTATTYLRAANEAALQAALATMDLWSQPGTDSDGQPTGGYVLAGPWGHLDVIGTIYSPTGQTTTDPDTGQAVPVMALDPGFHANLVTTAALTSAMQGIAIPTPKSPSRMFAV